MPTTYYRGPEVVITDNVFAVWTPCPMAFRLDELEAVHVVRGRLHPARFFAAFAAGLSVIGVAVSWPFLQSPGAYLAAVAAVAVPAVMNGVGHRLAPRSHELRAVYQGFEVELFSSPDVTTFGQVKRGLSRALEGRRYGAERFGTRVGAMRSG